MGGIFGGGDTKSTTSVQLSPEQRTLIGGAVPTFQSFLSQPPQPFPFSSVAGFTPAQIAGQEQALQAAQTTLPGIANQAINQQSFLAGPALFPETNPALQQATIGAVRPLVQAFEESIIPSIGRGAQAAGQFGGSRQGIAEGIAGRGLLQSIGDTSAALQNQAFQGGLDAFVKGLALQPQTAGLATLPGQVASAVGGQQQQQQQAFLSEAANRFIQEQLIPFQIAKDVAGIAFGIPGGTTIGQTQGGSPGFAQTAAGIGSLATGIGTLLSVF